MGSLLRFIFDFDLAFAVLPDVGRLNAVFLVYSPAMLLTVLPFAAVLCSVWPDENSIAMLLVELIVSFIGLAAWPNQVAMAMHLV